MSGTSLSNSNVAVDPSEWMEEFEGQLAIDVYETASELVVKAPIAGVKQEDLEVTITDEYISIKGERLDSSHTHLERYLLQECYWGSFTRLYTFPMQVDSDKALAKLVDGILTISIPKIVKTRTRTLPVITQ